MQRSYRAVRSYQSQPSVTYTWKIGAIAEYHIKIETGGKGLASTRQVLLRRNGIENDFTFTLRLRVAVSVLFCRGGWMIERSNLLCAGYLSTRGYASKLRLRVLVSVVFCRVSWMIERGNLLCAGYASTRGYASKLKLRARVSVVFCHVSWMIE